jgi:hypothetical protein
MRDPRREESVRRLECPRCGLSYHAATLPLYLLSASGASCPRCATPLVDASPDPDAERRPRLGSTPERHRAAVQRSLSWAERAAAEGQYATALAWLATIEAVEGELPPAFDAKRRAWAASAQAVAAEA